MSGPAKKAPPAKQPPAKAAEPAKRPEPAKAPPAKAEAKKAEPKKKSARDTLDETAADRGWTQGTAVPEGFDAVYTKANPVLGGYEHLRVKFSGAGLGEIEHENLNQQVPVPEEGAKLDVAVSILTGEPIPE